MENENDAQGCLGMSLLAIGIAIAVVACIFVFLTIGMAVGEREAGFFLAGVLGLAAIIGAAVHWSRKKEP